MSTRLYTIYIDNGTFGLHNEDSVEGIRIGYSVGIAFCILNCTDHHVCRVSCGREKIIVRGRVDRLFVTSSFSVRHANDQEDYLLYVNFVLSIFE